LAFISRHAISFDTNLGKTPGFKLFKISKAFSSYNTACSIKSNDFGDDLSSSIKQWADTLRANIFVSSISRASFASFNAYFLNKSIQLLFSNPFLIHDIGPYLQVSKHS
jgi:hypothetical protein